MRGTTHRVWVRVANRQAACGCCAFLQEGVCGHCDAAIRGAEQLGLLSAQLAGSSSEDPARPAEVSSRNIAMQGPCSHCGHSGML